MGRYPKDRYTGKLVSRAELAEIFAIQVTTIDNWKRQGMPVHQEGARGKRYQFNTADVHRWLVDRAVERILPESSNTDNGMDDGDDSISFDRARTRKMLADARRSEIDLAERRGQLASILDIGRKWAHILQTVKARLRGIPTKIAPIVFQSESVNEVKEEIEKEIDEVLNDLSRDGGESHVQEDEGEAA